jgi:hypothetical protein
MRDYSINTPVSDIWDWRSQGQQHLYFFLALTQRRKLYWQPSQLQQEGKIYHSFEINNIIQSQRPGAYIKRHVKKIEIVCERTRIWIILKL